MIVSAPPPSALKTIVTVHSTPFCRALRQGVAPVLRGLIRDDSLIALGRSAYATMNRDTTHGGFLQSSFNQQGAAQVVVSPGLSGFLEYRQREIATALEHNVEMLEAMLGDTKRFPAGLAGVEQSTLSTIKVQLASVVDDQRVVINVLNGATDTQQLADLFNAYPSSGSASLGGASPLQAQVSKYDPSLRLLTASYTGNTSFGNSVYGNLAQVITLAQRRISGSETVVAKTVIANAAGCAER